MAGVSYHFTRYEVAIYAVSDGRERPDLGLLYQEMRVVHSMGSARDVSLAIKEEADLLDLLLSDGRFVPTSFSAIKSAIATASSA